MKKNKYLILLLFLCIILAGCEKCINEYDKMAVGTVKNKKYTAAYDSTDMVAFCFGKIVTVQPRTRHHEAEYEVTIVVEDLSVTINDENLYNQYEIDDSIDMNVHYREYNDGTVERKVSVK